MMWTTGDSAVSAVRDSRFANPRKKFAKAFPSPSSIGTGSKGVKGMGFQGLGWGRVPWVVLVGGLAADVCLTVGLFAVVEAFWVAEVFLVFVVFLVLEVFLVVEVEVSSAAQVRGK